MTLTPAALLREIADAVDAASQTFVVGRDAQGNEMRGACFVHQEFAAKLRDRATASDAPAAQAERPEGGDLPDLPNLDDVPQRLRNILDWNITPNRELIYAALAEIDRLRAEVERVTAASGHPADFADLQRELEQLRLRAFGIRRVKGSDHSTACTIWGDDGQGHTSEGFEQPLPCNCGAIENFCRAEVERVTRERDNCARSLLKETEYRLDAEAKHDAYMKEYWAAIAREALLREAAEVARSAIDFMIGDTYLPEDDSPETLAMQAIERAISIPSPAADAMLAVVAAARERRAQRAASGIPAALDNRVQAWRVAEAEEDARLATLDRALGRTGEGRDG